LLDVFRLNAGIFSFNLAPPPGATPILFTYLFTKQSCPPQSVALVVDVKCNAFLVPGLLVQYLIIVVRCPTSSVKTVHGIAATWRHL